MARVDLLVTSEDDCGFDLCVDTDELSIQAIGFDCSEYLARISLSLPRLKRLVVRDTSIRSLDFLTAFPKLDALTLQCSRLESIAGVEAQPDLRQLYLGASLSTRGSLSPLSTLSKLQELGLEGPNPYKAAEEVGPLLDVRYMALYRPKWDMKILTRMVPNVTRLKILHSQAESIEFLGDFKNLADVEIGYFRRLKCISPKLRGQVSNWSIGNCPLLV